MSGAEDTIFAVAAGGGGAALTVVRMSGPDAGPILDRVCGGRPPARRASLRSLRDALGEVLDRGLVLWFPGPRSYTGEDSAELHLHGGRAVLNAVSLTLVAAGARPAEAGEFTRRAFLNGRMDLTEAEGVADLVAAETDAQRRQALRQMQGELGARYAGWTRRLIDIVASCETAIDFIDEPDGAMAATGVLEQASCLRREIAAHLDDGRRGERVREGLVFAIVGAPNVGKSSLLNALAASDVAIVSDRPGTTRDVVEARLSFAGVLVTLLDTAGLRESDDPLEAEGMRRARARAEEADLVIEVRDATAPDAAAADVVASNRMMVFNKVDMAPLCHSGCLGVSAVTGAGLPQLRNRLTAEASALAACGGDAPLTRARHRAALTTVADHLDGLMDAAWPELQAEEARLALRAQARITGAIGVEDVLDAIFRQFCIGK